MKITGRQHIPSAEEVGKIISVSLSTLGTRRAEVAFFGGSFTGIPLEMQTSYLKAANSFIESGQICGIRLSTRPDYINDEVLENLKRYKVSSIELGAQSMCDDVLLASKRGHTAADTIKASEKIRKYGFRLGLQMMVGLPCDTRGKSEFTARKIVRLGADCARIYPTCVIKNTELYDMYLDGKYKPLELSEAVETSASVHKILTNGGVDVIRCGLQATDTLGEEICVGPYHPAFGEMVKSRIVRDEMEEKIKSLPNDREIIFEVPQDRVSQFVGHQRSNILYLQKKYNVSIKIKTAKA